MRRNNLLLLCFLFGAGLSLLSCQKSLEKNNSIDIPEIAPQVQVPPGCGNALTKDLEDLGGNVSGSVVISNDANNYYIKITETLTEYKIGTVKLLYGSEESVASRLRGLIQCGFQAPTNPDLIITYNPEQDEVLITIPINSIPLDCFFFHARITVVKRDPGTGQVLYAYDLWTKGTTNASQNPCQTYYQYCKQLCTPTDCGRLNTVTMGGWGAEPNGQNNGTYLHNNFGSLGGSVSIGCNGGYKLTFTTAQAITNFLPASGKPAVLKASAVNLPELKNTLAGQVLALTLNVRFDATDPNFGQGGQSLGGMYITSGVFAGKTVSELLTIANNVLGGCSNAYAPDVVSDAAMKINENYDNGANNGFLSCTRP